MLFFQYKASELIEYCREGGKKKQGKYRKSAQRLRREMRRVDCKNFIEKVQRLV